MTMHYVKDNNKNDIINHKIIIMSIVTIIVIIIFYIRFLYS